MAIIDSVRTFLKTCPLLKGGKINVNYLGEKPARYSVDTVPTDPVIKKYASGDSLRQFLFVFASRECYDENELENMDTAKFYEEFGAWIEEQEKNGVYPELADGLRPARIEVLTSGYLFDSDERTARFQIQCRLIYYKGA